MRNGKNLLFQVTPEQGKSLQHSREVSFVLVMNLFCAVAAAQSNCPVSLDLASITLPSSSPQTTTFQEYLLMQKFACFPTATRCTADCVQEDDRHVDAKHGRNHPVSCTCLMGPVWHFASSVCLFPISPTRLSLKVAHRTPGAYLWPESHHIRVVLLVHLAYGRVREDG